MALLDDKRRREAKKAVQHCQACGQYLSVLREIGAPNEVLEQQNEANQRIITRALEIDERHSQSTK